MKVTNSSFNPNKKGVSYASSFVNISGFKFIQWQQHNKHSTISVISAFGVSIKQLNQNNTGKVVQLDVSSLESGV